MINENTITIYHDIHNYKPVYYIVNKGPHGMQYLSGYFNTYEEAERELKRRQNMLREDDED